MPARIAAKRRRYAFDPDHRPLRDGSPAEMVEVALHPFVDEIAQPADPHADADDFPGSVFVCVAEHHLEKTFRNGKLMHD